ncbi:MULTISPECIES: acyltransferase [unclassified Actinotalea]|uniref:acyltransferase family protein n=1 Tax=unclassified Actinotalea TaxID=2638618 RepID=UPI0015F6BB39|nr:MULTISPECIES: acyltransferase [unclassified Actinotalea]
MPSPRTPEGGRAGTAAGSRLRTLDGLRFGAAAGVLLYHFTARWSTAWGEEPAARFGELGRVTSYFALGPELFFVISGFVILWSAWGRSVPAVVGSRVGRLFPAYWTALVLTSVLLLVLWPDGKDITLGQVAVNATLLQEVFAVAHVDGVYWTLWAELRFYAIVVVLVAVGLTRRRVLAFCALWPLAGLVAEHAGASWAQTLLVSRYAPLFAGGMLLFLIHRDGHARLPWALVGLNVVVALVNVVPAQLASLSRNTAFVPSPVVLGLLVVGCFAAVAALTLTRLARVDLPVLTTLGVLTYPLYLVHEYWGWWTIHLLHDAVPTPVALLAAVAVSLGLAWAVHRVVEKRAQGPLRAAVEAGLSRLVATYRPRGGAVTRPRAEDRALRTAAGR